MTEHKIVDFGGTKFYLVKVSPTYTKAIPVDDPMWLARAMHETITRDAAAANKEKTTR